jgi:uncharacterized membrane protein
MQLDWLAIVLRWMHILAAITAVGGTIFMRMALVPSVAILPDAERKALHEQVRSRWIKFVMAASVLDRQRLVQLSPPAERWNSGRLQGTVP